MNDLVSKSELNELYRVLPAGEALKVRALAMVLVAFDRSNDKQSVVASSRESLERLGVKGISMASLYRKLELYREGGLLALVDGRLLRKAEGGTNGLGANREFCDFWVDLVAQNRRSSAAAYRTLFYRLQAGEVIPGVGTWRDLWQCDHRGAMPPNGMQCPYKPYSETPKGWSYNRLRQIGPDKFALTAARQGMMAAVMETAPALIRTRVGLAPCQVVQVDDMWHEVKVTYALNKRAERVAEFSMIDVATGMFISWLTKPVIRRGDGTRSVLKSHWARYLIAHLLCNVGIPKAGCLIMGEHGTASADSELQQVLSDVSGGRVKFGAGGMLSEPLGKGLYRGTPKGNPRYKALLEGQHSLVKNELGAIEGNVGGGRDKQPEETYGMDAEDAKFREMAAELEVTRPGILERLRGPYPNYTDFRMAVNLAYARINSREWHHLEGWHECGYTVKEWRINRDMPWVACGTDPTVAELVRSGKAEVRDRRMSPREAFESRRGELEKVDLWAVPLILGEGLARMAKVTDRLQMVFRDEESLMEIPVLARLTDGRILERGKEYKLWLNPMAADVAHVATAEGLYLGTAPVQPIAMAGDTQTSEAMAAALGMRSAVIAEAKKSLGPIVAGRTARALEKAVHNLKEVSPLSGEYDVIEDFGAEPEPEGEF